MNDPIDRQAAIDAICKEGTRLERNGTVAMCEIKQWCVDLLEQLPSAQTELSEIKRDLSDLISRQAAIDALCNDYCGGHQDCKYYPNCENLKSIEQLPSAQPEIIRCRNCKFASGDSRICMQFGHSPIGELDFCAWAERRSDE